MNQTWAQQTMDRILAKLNKTSKEIGATFPHATTDGKYSNEKPQWWTNGFWPGTLWLGYQHSKNEDFKNIAQEIENNLDQVLNGFYEVDHDTGFIWMLSAVAQYKILGTEESRRRGLMAAHFLASRFNPKGNFIRAWNSKGREGWAIIDCTMNISIMYWASEQLEDPRLKHIASEFADTVVEYFIRPDGSVNHVLSFDPETGEFIESLGGQANAPDSAWSRGTAWAIYGLALAYYHTKDQKYLDAAKRAANFFISNLPDDYVPYWDFRVERTPETPRDSSAGSCTACGLLEIAQHVPECEAAVYKDAAYKILKSLTDNYSNLDNDADQSLIRMGTGNMPARGCINVGLIYGDYFYVEGISRLTGNTDIFWY